MKKSVLPGICITIISGLLLPSCSVKNLPAVKPVGQMAFSAAVPSEYRIRPGDQLVIKFFYNPGLDEQVIVRPDGRISLQLAHEIMTTGLTPAQLTEKLTKIYSPLLHKAEITVMVSAFGGQEVFVDGEVNKPGMLSLASPMSVLQSLSQAGGIKDTAERRQILIVRRDFLPGNRPFVLSVNIDKVLDGTGTNQDIYLLPDDIVYVPKSRIADVNMWVDQYLRKNIPINVEAGGYYNFNRHTQ
ncbi:MAG: polysaccharide biosynthesis/export family protein [Nitrospiraceae bacterium]|nr:polysaccharide biosynthesis/export family protein [Nitrospiraceae bacterium]